MSSLSLHLQFLNHLCEKKPRKGGLPSCFEDRCAAPKVTRRLQMVANPMVRPTCLDQSTCARVVPAKPALDQPYLFFAFSKPFLLHLLSLVFPPFRRLGDLSSGFLTTTRDRNLQFRGAVSTGFFLNFLQLIFSFSPGFLCNSVRNRPQNVQKLARFVGGEKSPDIWIFGRLPND